MGKLIKIVIGVTILAVVFILGHFIKIGIILTPGWSNILNKLQQAVLYKLYLLLYTYYPIIFNMSSSINTLTEGYLYWYLSLKSKLKFNRVFWRINTFNWYLL